MIWNFEVIVAVIGSLGAAGVVLRQLANSGRRKKGIEQHYDNAETMMEDIRQTGNKDD